MSRRLRPTGRGIALTAVGALALGLGLVARYPGLVALGAAALGLVVVAVVSLLLPVPLDVTHRLVPGRVARLGSAAAHIALRNASPWLSVRVAGTDNVGGRDIAMAPTRLAPRDSGVVEVPVPTERRGLLPVGPFVLERRSPADLVRSRERRGGSSTLQVTPRLIVASGPPTGRRRGHSGAQERVEHGGTDLVGLREYVPGDDLRRVHWASSARHGIPMVREDADPAEPHLTVLLDDRASAYRPGTAGDGFEEAVDVAASLVHACASGGVPVRCVTLSGSLDVAAPAGVPGSDEPLRAAAHAVDRLTLVATTDRPLAGTVTVPSGGGPGPDVLAVVTGAAAPVPPLLLAARGADTVALLVVDPAPLRSLGAADAATVVRGPRAEDLLRGWDLAVAP
ncbi:protein of unknown function DUF58 [Cellulomonas flavigena DSM 20109]|uniref:DUF58 domain-containing protein n=1 Tax=Cellulomonas flavigena (strain ATCC 482 / DSM 20109 / BCRC 11376 / JCM 18109 / NBRC 3775 / NCIMB 8073 / NRS 134) TaxID=446466 RepID=D5ULL2_CELFN|nr:DUF58 domain-containing protein [Cellulomonas flavigena]ADG74054.1 protein of unknown function DUF58 [Cellulomonas flavigena DSM 20109]